MSLTGKNAKSWQQRFAAHRHLQANWMGEIAGVMFDFRHPALPPHSWDCPSVLDGQPWDHPGWYFTGVHEGSGETLLGEMLSALSSEAVERAEAKGLVVLNRGDKVRAQTVETVAAVTDALQPEADQAVARLHVIVESIAGVKRRGASCLVYRKGAILPARLDIGVLDTFGDRVSQLPRNDVATAQVRQLKARVDKGLEVVELDMRRRLEQIPNLPGSMFVGGIQGVEIELRRLVNMAALYGYRLGRAEAAHHMEDMARTGDARTTQSLDAAEIAANKNRNVERKDFAEAFWTKYPDATIYAAIEDWRRAHPNHQDSDSSLRRSFELYGPETSPSYSIAQKNISKRRSQRARAHRR
jgi:hypothetical protein